MLKWTERDLNPRLPRCERGDHTRLIYRPIFLCEKRLKQLHLELSVSRVTLLGRKKECSCKSLETAIYRWLGLGLNCFSQHKDNISKSKSLKIGCTLFEE